MPIHADRKFTPADDELDLWEPAYRASCAATAALVANTLTYPLDVVRARLTLQGASGSGGGAVYSGIGGALRTILRTEGVRRGLFRGLAPTLAAVVPFVAVQNTSIDLLKVPSKSNLP